MGADILAAALRLARLGLPIHWLRSPAGDPGDNGRGKAPIHLDWPNAPYIPPQHVERSYRQALEAARRRGWALDLNLGLHTGAVVAAPVEVVAIDFDSTEALSWGRGHLPPTPWRTVTRHGEHWLYRRPADHAPIGNRVGIRSATDIRGDRGNVVVAGSVHPSGFRYREAQPWVVADLPVFDPAWFPAPPRPAPLAPRQERPSDLIDRRVKPWLRAMPIAVSGQQGHTALFNVVAGLWIGWRLPDGDARWLLNQYNERCLPPWSERELEHKIRQMSGCIRQPGYLLNAPRRRAA